MDKKETPKAKLLDKTERAESNLEIEVKEGIKQFKTRTRQILQPLTAKRLSEPEQCFTKAMALENFLMIPFPNILAS